MNAKKTKAYLGVDIGSISTKAVVIDKNNKIYAQSYLWTEGNPINAVKKVIQEIKSQLQHQSVMVVGVGTTGSARELIGTILNATLVKNEITAHAIGTLQFHPDVRTIFEIGGQDSKVIIIDQGIVVDYAMNTLCAAGTGSFLSSQARRLNIPVEEFGGYAMKSKNPTRIAGRCTVFAESDLVHKAQMGHPNEDIIAGLCNAIVNNYLNNVAKGKNIEPPVVFQGGVSKNIGVVRSFKKITGYEILVDEIGHLMGAIGVAVLVREQECEQEFDFNIQDIEYTTVGIECGGCANNCEVICVLQDGKLLDTWGNRCSIGADRARLKIEQGLGSVFEANVQNVSKIATATIAVTLAKPPDFNFQAGQYVFITLPDLKDKGANESMRAMSLASAPHEKDLLLSMRISDSLFKQTIKDMPKDSLAELEGPFGDMMFTDSIKKPAVFIAGGVGVTPFMSIIKGQEHKGWSRSVHFFYSNKNPESAAFLQYLQSINDDKFIFIPTMTRLADGDKWSGEVGRIDEAMLRKYISDVHNVTYYIVGLPDMVKSTHKLLQDMEIDKDDIYLELFATGSDL